MLTTRFTTALGIDHPILSAPMANHSDGILAAAVCKAGALGGFGGINTHRGPEWVRAQIETIREATDKPFAVGFVNVVLDHFDGHFQAALDAGAPVIALSFGDPQPWVARAKDAGAKVVYQVQTRRQAAAAVAAGADFLVAQGNEAGGHTGVLGLLPFLTDVIDMFPDTPVLAAGGIANARSLAAVLAAGAEGVWIGTAFLATVECVDVPEAYKELIVASDGEDTIFTRSYDIVSGVPWPPDVAVRVRRNEFTKRWHGRDEELLADRTAVAAELRAAAKPFNAAETPTYCGESAGAVRKVRTVAELIDELTTGAAQLLSSRVAALGLGVPASAG